MPAARHLRRKAGSSGPLAFSIARFSRKAKIALRRFDFTFRLKNRQMTFFAQNLCEVPQFPHRAPG
jgi:hypothetical protein